MLFLLFYIPLAFIVYHFLLFPLILTIWAFRRPVRNYELVPDTQLPTVDLFVLARNEEDVISEKIQNCLSLDYPGEKLRIFLVANGCTDNTVTVGREFEDKGVQILEFESIGKTEAQKRAVHRTEGDVLVFSDANTMYDRDAIRELVKPLQDPTVGSVCGNHVYDTSKDPRSETEGIVWNLTEKGLKELESQTGGTLGANGSIYAVRRELFKDLPSDIIEDFWQPMLIAADGYRTVFNAKAVSREKVEMPDLKLEHARKMRIVQQSVAALIRYRWIMNPLRFPRTSWLMFSHKVLRWITPFLLLSMSFSSTLRLILNHARKPEQFWFIATTLLGFLALLGRGLGRMESVPVLSQAYYAVLMLDAALRGTIGGITKGSIATWDRAR